MANKQRNSKRESFWRATLARQAKSELTVRAFCRYEKLHDSAFYFWRRTIAERDAQGSVAAAPAFVPVVLSGQSMASPAEIKVDLRGGRTLRLSESIAVERLAAIVLALESAEARS
jgi:hypothetical protein